MCSHRIINVTGTEPGTRDLEEQFNQWYNETHVPFLLKHSALKRVTRYKRIGGDDTLPPYLAFYEFENKEDLSDYLNSPERTAALENTKDTWKMDKEFKVWGITQYELIKCWEKK